MRKYLKHVFKKKICIVGKRMDKETVMEQRNIREHDIIAFELFYFLFRFCFFVFFSFFCFVLFFVSFFSLRIVLLIRYKHLSQILSYYIYEVYGMFSYI